ncbi:MAG: hypothetical protein KAH44_31790 [Oricola sp.]|jgi:hypothetical protein|nr:hypothetical protein [Oricola sp.]
MASASLQGKTVRELQELAVQAPAPRRRRKPRLSRAARLHLIDILSRWSGLGLALVAGVSVYMAVVAGRAYPARAAAWALMMLAALWTARRLRAEFRDGSRLSSRPFRWRASFTASLSVLGVVLASAPILLAPAGAAPVFGVQILALAVTASFAAALLAAAHLPSAAALAIPGAIFAVLAALRAGDSGLLVASLATSWLGLTGLYLANRRLEKTAGRAYPRTMLVRREALRQTAAGAADATPSSSALQA